MLVRMMNEHSDFLQVCFLGAYLSTLGRFQTREAFLALENVSTPEKIT